jgi:two-component system sensor kinase FixL
MGDAQQPQAQLLQEIAVLRQRLAQLEAEPAGRQAAGQAQRMPSEARLRAIWETVVDSIITFDADGHIESVNPAAERLFGYRAAELIGQRLTRLLSAPTGEEQDSDLEQFLRTGDPQLLGRRREVLGQRQDGTPFPMEVVVRAVGFGDQRLFTAIVRDLSERQRLEGAMRRLEQLALMGRLAASVAHELRDPLNTIFLHADLLEEELQQPSPDHQSQLAASVAEIKTEVSRLHDLIEDYLSMARLASLHREAADLGTFVTAWAQDLEELVTSRGITLDRCGLGCLGAVVFHPNTLRRALVNLMQNALEAMPAGGRLTLRGRCSASEAHLEISDTGVGIPEDDLPLIFEPLHTTKAAGTGLGLYLVREIVAAHDGHLAVHSVPGEGTTFTLTLPRAAGTHR